MSRPVDLRNVRFQGFSADREMVHLALETENDEARPVWNPLHTQPVFVGCDIFGQGASDRLCAEGLCLSSGSSMVAEDQQRVADRFNRTFDTGKSQAERNE